MYPPNLLNIVLECKEEVMEGEYGIDVTLNSILSFKDPFPFLVVSGLSETLRIHRNPYGGSPFAGDCPVPGPFAVQIIDTSGKKPGHSVMCYIDDDNDYCLENGAARITCIEHPDQGGGSYDLTISSGGYISHPATGAATQFLVVSYIQ